MHYDYSLPLACALCEGGVVLTFCSIYINLLALLRRTSCNTCSRRRRMLTYDEYSAQLRRLCDSALKNSDLVTSIQPSLADGAVLFRTALPSSIAYSTLLCCIEFKICYSHAYQEPRLLFRLWRRAASQEEGIDFLAPWFPTDVAQVLGIDRGFTVSLDALFSNSSRSQETWFAFHPCDTAEIVGDKLDFKDDYLSRWLSIFLFSWLAKS
ncbi:hypothetical protein HG536_0A01770 [Torulaspora globosa]|uniref:Uncharacterized protein n=1 Tax=Torulaspora globosa TaxID=48254 RepID=A0A7G3ZA24_9SACH|nr:uncharacterized protein HG536_0A01770 [Torulaspora globosa]QLL30360.1 hypothetical protein HG536_0A01770 [Torulaspora globosa]